MASCALFLHFAVALAKADHESVVICHFFEEALSISLDFCPHGNLLPQQGSEWRFLYELTGYIKESGAKMGM